MIANIYRQNKFLDGTSRSSGHSLAVGFHYPRQFLLSRNLKWFSEDRTKRTTYSMGSAIEDLEILNRRNKRKQRCMRDGRKYDNLILKQHITNYLPS